MMLNIHWKSVSGRMWEAAVNTHTHNLTRDGHFVAEEEVNGEEEEEEEEDEAPLGTDNLLFYSAYQDENIIPVSHWPDTEQSKTRDHQNQSRPVSVCKRAAGGELDGGGLMELQRKLMRKEKDEASEQKRRWSEGMWGGDQTCKEERSTRDKRLRSRGLFRNLSDPSVSQRRRVFTGLTQCVYRHSKETLNLPVLLNRQRHGA